VFIDLTRLLVYTGVEFLVLDSSLKEALAGLAGKQAVVETTHLVAAYWAQVVEAELDVQTYVGRVNVKNAD